MAMSEHRDYTNQLINETSPYLLQHAHNPVNWYPWGADALEKARRADPALILLDVVMPDVRGIELLGPIHEQDPEIVCVIVTGYATVDLAAGTHAVRVEYFERTGTARVQVSWKPIGGAQPTLQDVVTSAALSEDLSVAMNNIITLYLIAAPGQGDVYRVPLEAYARNELASPCSIRCPSESMKYCSSASNMANCFRRARNSSVPGLSSSSSGWMSSATMLTSPRRPRYSIKPWPTSPLAPVTAGAFPARPLKVR